MHRLKRAKVTAAFLLIFIFGISLHRFAAFLESTPITFLSSFQRLPWRPLGDACFVAFFLGLTYEWLVRRESEINVLVILRQHLTDALRRDFAELQKRLTTEFRAIPLFSESDFFDHLEAHLLTARQRVDLSYFDNRPPSATRTPRGLVYLRHLEEIIRTKPDVHFRRIIRTNEAMLPRIEELIKSETGAANSSVACFLDGDPTEECVDAATLQLIDDEVTFFVSVATQKTSVEPRDIVVYSPVFCAMWSKYYDRLWRKSVLLIDRGTFIEASWSQVQKSTGEQKGGASSQAYRQSMSAANVAKTPGSKASNLKQGKKA